MKGIWVLAVVCAFVAGSIITGATAYAASNAQGQPFQALQQQITQIQEQIGGFTVDSFFDIMYRITVPSCPEGERPTLNAENNGYTCVPRASFDSFFDIVVDTKAQVDTIQTEIVALQLVSHEPLTVTDIQNFGFELGPHTDLGTIPTEIVALTQQVADLQDEVADLEAQLAELQGPDCIVILIAQDANFSGCDFNGANFNGANLLSADFSDANLSNASFANAFLQFSDFSGANLTFANLLSANLSDADFTGADLNNTFLMFTIFSGANFSGANLMNADFSEADLTGADFSGSNLQDAFGGPFVGCINHPLCV